MAGTQEQTGDVVWTGRPSIGVYVALYAVVAVLGAAILVALEVRAADGVASLSGTLFASLRLGPVVIPDALEVVTALAVLILFLAKVVGLAIYRAGHSFELRTDGLYFNRGIANLQNVFLSAMAFSDARLLRTLGMRIVGRSTIIVEANDGRRFEMRMLKDGVGVQTLIRSNLSHPTVRIEKQA
ncbi:MAG: hypothetical protein ABSF83_11365 [Nitrososphaerales archaeon]|jgi:hypothetical protein